MALNIKTEEAHRLAREIADLTGESMTAAVTIAVRERRDRLRTEREGGVAERILKIGRRSADRLPPAFRELDADELLYTADGLPR